VAITTVTRRWGGRLGATVGAMNQEEPEASRLRDQLRRCRRQCRDIARDIHDGPFHDMTAVVLLMAAARSEGASLQDYAARCREAQERLRSALGDLRRDIHRLERCGRAGGD
jgi:signal transduction histidine kinase